VMVISGLETTGLLATLSRNAATAIDLRHDSTCRIRMTQPSADAFSSADAFRQAREAPRPQYQLGPIDSAGVIVFADEIELTAPAPVIDTIPLTAAVETADETQFEQQIISGAITLVPAEERLPPIHGQPAATANGNTAIVPPSVTRVTVSPALNTLSGEEFSPFQAPLISSLAPGKWYVQLCVYSRPDNVEDEINRIGAGYPVAIQNVGTDTSPMFRVLLGPLNQGESGAILQRFKSIGYNDAFVRQK